MSDRSDFESVASDDHEVAAASRPTCRTGGDDDSRTSDNNNSRNSDDNNYYRTGDESCYSRIVDNVQQQHRDASFTDSDHSLLGVTKRPNASSPSSVYSTRPLEWDSGADVGYDVTSKNHRSREMSTIEKIAVSGLVNHANSTPIGHAVIVVGDRPKSNSLVDLNGPESATGVRSASFEALKSAATVAKYGTLPKRRSPMTSTQSVSTVVHRPEQTLETFRNLNASKDQKLSDSSKESNGTSSSVDTAGSWVAKESRDSTNATTDRVNSFEYLPGIAYYSGRSDQLEDSGSDKEYKQSIRMLVSAMKQNGLTDKIQRKKILNEIIESVLKNFTQKNGSSSVKSTSDTDQSPIRQDFTSQTSNTSNTIVNKQTNNHSSTITFTSPITSSRFGDDVDSKYDESSMDSGRHLDLKKCKSKKIFSSANKQKNQSVQCTIQNSSESVCKNKNTNKSSSISKTEKKIAELSSKQDDQSTSKSNNDINKEFIKQMLWFQKKFIKIERENQKLWINQHLSHLKNLEKLCHTHEELNQNWNSFKQKPTTNNKPKFRKSSIPVSSSSSDFTSTIKTDSTVSSKQQSADSKLYDTDVESSATLCNHVHFKKGVLVNEPKSMTKCCENTLHVIEEKQCIDKNKFKIAWSQTKSTEKTNFKSYKEVSPQSRATYTIDRPLKQFECKKSVSYDIIFKPTSRCTKNRNDIDKECKKQNRSISVACQTNKIPFEPKPSLQEYLMFNRPDYVCRAEERQNILAKIANLRDERKQVKRDLLITNNTKNRVPPNPLTVMRIMSQKDMRKQTEHKYRKCPEVKNKKIEKKRQEEYKTNKIMANIFNKRLQKKTLNGNVNLSNSVSVCSS